MALMVLGAVIRDIRVPPASPRLVFSYLFLRDHIWSLMTIYLEKWTEGSRIKDSNHSIKGNEDMITFRVLYKKKFCSTSFSFLLVSSQIMKLLLIMKAWPWLRLVPLALMS